MLLSFGAEAGLATAIAFDAEGNVIAIAYIDEKLHDDLKRAIQQIIAAQKAAEESTSSTTGEAPDTDSGFVGDNGFGEPGTPGATYP